MMIPTEMRLSRVIRFPVALLIVVAGTTSTPGTPWQGELTRHTYQDPGGPCESNILEVAQAKRLDLVLGTSDVPEINIDDLKIGPRGWMFGVTEENGYIFVFDPQTGDSHVWNAGRQSPVTDRPFEGDITDLDVWEEDGALIIVAAHALPAEIYRYQISLPAKGLPPIGPEHGRLVYRNDDWARVGAVARGRSVDGHDLLIAGSINKGGLIRSYDGGSSWEPLSYVDRIEDVEASHLEIIPNKYSSFHEIYFHDGTWFVLTDRFAPLSVEADQGKYKHFTNGILVSRDGAESWSLAKVEGNDRLPQHLRDAVNQDREANLLPTNLFGLVGEKARRLTVLADGRLLLSTAMSNLPHEGLGGRLLISNDGGATWGELFHFPNYRAVTTSVLPDGGLIVGTSTKTRELQRGEVATGELWLSRNQGDSFEFCQRLVTSDQPSPFEDNPYWIVGVSALAVTEEYVVAGTVSEGEHAELFAAKLQPSPRLLHFDENQGQSLSDDEMGVVGELGRSGSADVNDPRWVANEGLNGSSALVFDEATDGFADYVTVNDSRILDSKAISFEGYIRPSRTGDDKQYVFQRNGPGGTLSLYLRGSALYAFANVGGIPLKAQTTLDLGDAWHRVGIAFDGRALQLFLEGALVRSRTYETLQPMRDMRSVRVGTYFTGVIDEVKILAR